MSRVDDIYDDIELLIHEHKTFQKVIDENIRLKNAIEDIKAEIETLQSDTNVMMYSLAISDVLEIIDKHISGKEN